MKNNAFIGPEFGLPAPNTIAQRPSIVKGRLSGPRNWSYVERSSHLTPTTAARNVPGRNAVDQPCREGTGGT